jgi:uncharacterized protein (DUF433 family)
MQLMNLPDVLPSFLYQTPQGTWRITGTRVSLDSVIYAFWERAAPEEICQDFLSLSLPQVYCVIAYYLTHRDKVDAYLQEQQRAAVHLHKELQSRHGSFLAEVRQRLLTRRMPSVQPA